MKSLSKCCEKTCVSKFFNWNDRWIIHFSYIGLWPRKFIFNCSWTILIRSKIIAEVQTLISLFAHVYFSIFNAVLVAETQFSRESSSSFHFTSFWQHDKWSKFSGGYFADDFNRALKFSYSHLENHRNFFLQQFVKLVC